MSFFAPAAFAFAAALPVVVLFYLLKRKRVVRLVSSTLLWRKFLAETQASAPFQKLRHNWLLVLQLLMLAFVILALSRPYFADEVEGGRLLVTVLDASASMQSRDEAPTRFDSARKAALALVDNLQGTDQMVVLLAAGNTEVKQSPTSNKAALRRAIQSCDVSDSPTRLAEALRLAKPLVKDRRGAEIHLFSDGAAADLSEFEHEGLNVVYRRFGRRAENVGIVTLDVRAHPDDPRQRALFTSVANASTNGVETELELLFDGQLIETRALTLQPKETRPLVLVVNQRSDGVFTVRLTVEDDLPADNQASAISLLARPVRVLLISRGNRFLEKALTSVPNSEVVRASDLADEAPDFDVTVLDDVLPRVWPAGNVLSIRSAPTNWVKTVGSVETPAIVDWRNTHPLLRFVNLDNVQIAETLAVEPPPWAIPLVESPQTPLILAGELGRQRIVWIGFDTLQSTWPLRISFPIFVANAVDWLNPSTANPGRFQVQSGDPFRLALTGATPEAVIELPDRSTRTLPLGESARELVFGDTRQQGVYTLEVGTNTVRFCVNLLDAAETDTMPRDELEFGKYVKVEAASLKPANMEIWRWIAALGLLLLLSEWWYYHRRTA